MMALPADKIHTFLEPMVFQNLANCGFLDIISGMSGLVGSKKNEFGQLFVEKILCEE
jgi:hypothetical protein